MGNFNRQFIKMLTLNETWEKCHTMWKWIDEVWEDGMVVGDLKRQWLVEHDPGFYPLHDCYFCEYDAQQKPERECRACPLGGNMYRCSDVTHNWQHKPKAFFALVDKLYNEYLENKPCS